MIKIKTIKNYYEINYEVYFTAFFVVMSFKFKPIKILYYEKSLLRRLNKSFSKKIKDMAGNPKVGLNYVFALLSIIYSLYMLYFCFCTQ